MSRRRMRAAVANAADGATERAAARATSKLAVMLGPFVVLVLEFVVALLMYAKWGGTGASELVTAFLGVASVLCTWLILAIGRDRSLIGRVHGALTPPLIGVHLVWAVHSGPWSEPLFDVWLLGGLLLALTWALRLRVALAGGAGGSWFEQAAAAAGFTGMFRPRQVTEDRVKGPLQLGAGTTVQDVQTRSRALASALQVPPNGVRIAADPNNARAGELTIVRRDMLREVLPFERPSEPGKSSAVPLRVGKYETADVMVVPMHVPGLGMAHLLVQGMTGSGKTAFAKMLMAGRFVRNDVYTIMIDTKKGGQSLPAMVRGLRWVELDSARVRQLFRCIVTATVPYRSSYLGQRGLDMWMPGCGIPRLDLHIEEASGLVTGSAFVHTMELCRSVGIHITASFQRASYTSVDVQARQQFSTVAAFGCKDEEDAAFAMPDEILAAGADPSQWRNTRPGYLYLVGPGIDEELWTTPGRIELITNEELAVLAEYSRIHGCELDQGTIDTFGDLFETRMTMEEVEERLSPSQVRGATILTPRTHQAPAWPDDDEVDDLTGDELDDGTGVGDVDPLDEDDELPPAEGADIEEVFARDGVPEEDRPRWWQQPVDKDDPDVNPGIDDELPPATGDIRFAPPGRGERASDDVAHTMFIERFNELVAEGKEVLRGTDFTDLTLRVGRSPAWVYNKLKRLIKEGRLERVDEGFRVIQDRRTGAAAR